MPPPEWGRSMPAESGLPEKIEIIARGLLWSQDRILFCRSKKHGHCYLPGGHVEAGESATDALAREFIEETGLAMSTGEPLLVSEQRFVQRGKPRHEISIVFHVEHSDGAPETVPSTLR